MKGNCKKENQKTKLRPNIRSTSLQKGNKRRGTKAGFIMEAGAGPSLLEHFVAKNFNGDH